MYHMRLQIWFTTLITVCLHVEHQNSYIVKSTKLPALESHQNLSLEISRFLKEVYVLCCMLSATFCQIKSVIL